MSPVIRKSRRIIALFAMFNNLSAGFAVKNALQLKGLLRGQGHTA